MKVCNHRYKTHKDYNCHATLGYPKPKCNFWNAIFCIVQKKLNKILLYLK